MTSLPRIFIGDNQFLGINHASEERARQQALQFQSASSVRDVLRSAYEAGIRGFMCTTHEKIREVLDLIRDDLGNWSEMVFCPGMPYAHKYANAVTELGYFGAVRRLLPEGGVVDVLRRGGEALIARDITKVATLLIDAEMKPFSGLPIPVIFLQNVATDLLLGLGYHEGFALFADHIRTRYGAEPGFYSMNLPMLLPALASVGIENPIVCANVNKVGFRMCGGIEAYRVAAAQHPCRVIAMSVLASGALSPRDAIEWVSGEPYVHSILFGASSAHNIHETVKLIKETDKNKSEV